MGIAQVRGNRSPAPGSHVREGTIDRQVRGVGLRGSRDRNNRLGEEEARFRHADEGDSLGDTDACREHLWRGHADLLRGGDHDAPRDEARILSGLDHARQVVQGGIDVRAAHRLDESARHA